MGALITLEWCVLSLVQIRTVTVETLEIKTGWYRHQGKKRESAEKFKQEFPDKFDFIFSDALHTPEAIRSEYELIIKDSLAENFIIYYDDLDFIGLEEEFSKIILPKRAIFLKRHYTLYFFLGFEENAVLQLILTNYNEYSYSLFA